MRPAPSHRLLDLRMKHPNLLRRGTRGGETTSAHRRRVGRSLGTTGGFDVVEPISQHTTWPPDGQLRVASFRSGSRPGAPAGGTPRGGPPRGGSAPPAPTGIVGGASGARPDWRPGSLLGSSSPRKPAIPAPGGCVGV